MKLSIEELKDMSAFFKSTGMGKYARAIDELISIRELKGDQVPYGYYSAETATIMEQQGHANITKEPSGNWQFALFTAPQKPVVPDDLREDILRCVDEAMTGCNSLSAPDYAVRVAGWLSAGGVVKDGE